MHPYQIATLVTLGLTFFVLAGGLIALRRKVRKDEHEPVCSQCH